MINNLQVHRSGFSLVELQVAFVVLAIAVCGLCPLVVMQSRHLKKIENRLNPANTHYITPSTDSWARKLGAGAAVATADPGAASAAAVLIFDDGDSGFSTLGSGWNRLSGSNVYPPGILGLKKKGGTSTTAASAFGGDCYYHSSGNGSKTATWEFTGLTPGWYEVRITWLQGSGLATDAPFTVYEGSDNLGSRDINQMIAPSGAVYGGRPWESLGTFSIQGATLTVKLTNDANGKVIADAVRLVPVQNDLQVLSIDKSLTGDAVTAHVSVNVLVPQ